MRYWQHRVRFTPLVVLILWVLGAQTSAVWATGSGCRTDPKFFFGNGDILTIVATADVAKSDVTGIRYVVHAPAAQQDDQSEVRIVYTGLPPGIEQAEVVFDLESFLPGQDKHVPYAYYVEARVDAGGLSAPVTFEMWLDNQEPVQISGSTGEWLEMGVAR